MAITRLCLFHSFQTRQLAIAKEKKFWSWALLFAVITSLIASGVFIYSLQYVKTYNAPFGGPGGVPLIGNEILRRFEVVFDYTHMRLILEPNRHFRDAFDFDASGLTLRWERDAFLIHDVAKPSPAAEVGLQAGDAIIAIDGEAATSFRLDQVEKLFTQAGTSIQLTVRRSNKQLQISLPLRHRL